MSALSKERAALKPSSGNFMDKTTYALACLYKKAAEAQGILIRTSGPIPAVPTCTGIRCGAAAASRGRRRPAAQPGRASGTSYPPA